MGYSHRQHALDREAGLRVNDAPRIAREHQASLAQARVI